MADPVEPAASSRRRRSAAERREQILDAAVDVMRVGGIAAATTRAVAERAGLPQGAFHYCFRSKGEMFEALLGRELDASLAGLWDAVEAGDGFEQSIAAALLAMLARVRSDPDYHLVVAELVDVAARSPELAHLARREHAAYVEHATGLLERWQEAGGTALRVPARTLAEALVATATGITSAWLRSRDDEAAHASVALLARSLALAVAAA